VNVTFPHRFSVLAAVFTLRALAADTHLDPAKSTLVATFKQEGVAVAAPFRRFSGTIAYNAENVAASTAALDVDTGSLDLGDERYNAEVRKKAWFDSATFPKATFRATAIKPGSVGHFSASGTLTIKGRAQAILVPISVQNAAGTTTCDGVLTISRKSFGIGDPSWNDVLDDAVSVRFHLTSH
jgi:polyisoprenoid-binding protein YceI